MFSLFVPQKSYQIKNDEIGFIYLHKEIIDVKEGEKNHSLKNIKNIIIKCKFSFQVKLKKNMII
jgi:hypothetical protein